jgi:hypothetical protein
MQQQATDPELILCFIILCHRVSVAHGHALAADFYGCRRLIF